MQRPLACQFLAKSMVITVRNDSVRQKEPSVHVVLYSGYEIWPWVPTALWQEALDVPYHLMHVSELNSGTAAVWCAHVGVSCVSYPSKVPT